ncbi:MAG: hypothetical protein NTY22_07345 [Proteobacteria bacterium]|nr:hypothetical protein [Pseudomonadota bacterium]
MKKLALCFIVALLSFSAWSSDRSDRRDVSITFNYDNDNNFRGSLPVSTSDNMKDFEASTPEQFTDAYGADHLRIRLCFGTWTNKDRVNCNGREDVVIYTQGKDR